MRTLVITHNVSRTFHQLIEQAAPESINNASAAHACIRFKDGSEVEIRLLMNENDLFRFKGIRYDFIIEDSSFARFDLIGELRAIVLR